MADWAVDYSKADDTGAGNSWAAAKKTLKAATDLAAAGDTIFVHVGTDQAVAVDTTWTIAAGVRILASNDTANFPPTVLSTSGGIISPGSNLDKLFVGGPFLLKGFRIKVGAAALAGSIGVQGDATAAYFDDCILDISAATATTSIIRLGSSSTTVQNTSIYLRNCWFKLGNAAHKVAVYSNVVIEGGGVESGSTVPTTLFGIFSRSAGSFRMSGFDMSVMASGTIFGGTVEAASNIQLSHCKLGAATLADAGVIGGLDITGYDCSSSDTHYHLFHYGYAGSTTVSTAIYANDGAEYNLAGDKCSWVVAGNANTSRANPYISPWIQAYNEATAAITPELEILRDGSATAFTDIEVWSEWSLKTAGGSPIATLYSDYGGHLSTGTAQGNGVGLSGWTGESGTAWSGRLECPSVTPAEIGHVSARVVVAGNHTVYVDPQIRGL